ncbi:hypothetical protein F170042I7_30020 [Blautia caecimuris]
MKKMLKRLCTGFLALATVVTALPTTPVHAESKQYWTESKERVGIVEKVMNDGSIGSTFNEGHLTVEGEDAYCIDIKGALPYDTYIIEEMRCDSNKGFELIPPFVIVVSRNNLVIDLGTLTDEYEKEISIHTTATSKDGEKTILAGKEVTSLDGKQLVTFEELYDLSNPDESKKVTEHKDIEDKGQTITFKEKPEEPEKPETPLTPEKPNRPSDSPKTGDSTNVMAFVVMLLASAGGLAGTYLYKRRKMKKS